MRSYQVLQPLIQEKTLRNIRLEPIDTYFLELDIFREKGYYYMLCRHYFFYEFKELFFLIFENFFQTVIRINYCF